MNPTPIEIETLLRRAPRVHPPDALHEQLHRDIHLTRKPDQAAVVAGRSWWLAWWPVLAPACLIFVGMVMFAYQFRELRATQQRLDASKTSALTAQSVEVTSRPRSVSEADPRAELEQLEATARQLKNQLSEAELLRLEINRLKSEIAARAGNNPAQTPDPNDDKTKEDSKLCLENLKRLGIAARLWANDHSPSVYPSNVVSLAEDLGDTGQGSPVVLHCPSDTARRAATEWKSFTSANLSYEYLAPNGLETDPQRVMFRCPIHGHLAMCDGSAVAGIGIRHPESLRTIDGKIYFYGLPATK